MPATDPFKRYLDAGLEFTEITRKRAETIVKELVRAGEVQRDHAQLRVDELVDRSRHASAAFAEVVRSEVTRQLTDLGLVQAPKKAQTAAKTTAGEAKAAAGKAKTAAKKTTGTANVTAKKASGAAAKKATSAANKTTGAAKKASSTAKKASGK